MSGAQAEARRQLAATSAAVVLGLAPWFSATAVGPAMSAEWHLTGATSAWLTMAVQIGFVAGTLVSAGWMLADRWRAERLAAWSCWLAAAATAAIAAAHGATAAIALRVLTGVALAGVYPPAMKLVAGWWRTGRGFAIGVVVGALSLGSASPHLIRLLVPAGAWRAAVLAAALSAAAAGAVFLAVVRPGPYQARSSPLDRHALAAVLKDRGVMLATGGYLGHMWELYAMWSWLLAFWIALATMRGLPTTLPALMTFAAIASGGAGCIAAGWLADRAGRTAVTIGAMIVSGACALAIGPSMGASLIVPVSLTIIWGVSIVADSAQFSACITELVPAEYTGTALTLQTALGFLLTMFSIRAVPAWAGAWGWRHAFMPLAIGPALGCLAMWRLRQLPEAARLAGGAR